MTDAWREVRPDHWRRDLPSGGWLGVRPDRGSWSWVLMVPGPSRRRGSAAPDVASAFCFGLVSAEAAREHADEHAVI